MLTSETLAFRTRPAFTDSVVGFGQKTPHTLFACSCWTWLYLQIISTVGLLSTALQQGSSQPRADGDINQAPLSSPAQSHPEVLCLGSLCTLSILLSPRVTVPLRDHCPHSGTRSPAIRSPGGGYTRCGSSSFRFLDYS